MKLYELERNDKEGTKIYEECSDGSKYLLFHHIDGMYSYCKTEKGVLINLSASTPIYPFEDGYKIGNRELK